MLEISFGAAAFAGLLSFFTPCILPLVPFYLCYMAGLSMDELQQEALPGPLQRRLLASAVCFALGVSTIFVLLGLGATALGQLFADWQGWLRYLAAALLLLFGLHFLGLLRIGLLHRQARLDGPADPRGLVAAYVMGLAFGFGWTPCVGPALAAILMIAGGMGDLWHGAALLLVYALAMTAPFVLAAAFAGPFLRWLARHRRFMGHAEKVMGAMLVVLALLIAGNGLQLIANLMLKLMPGWQALG